VETCEGEVADQRAVTTATIIKLDIDGKLDFKRLESVIEKLKEMKCVLTKGEVWKSPHGYHVYIWTESIAETYLPCVQVLMGSDWKRELLNFERVLKDEPGWNVLFQEKEKFDKDKTATLRRVLL
jgi:hypothetical protein